MSAIKTASTERLGRIYNRRCNQQFGQMERRWNLLAAIKREISIRSA